MNRKPTWMGRRSLSARSRAVLCGLAVLGMLPLGPRPAIAQPAAPEAAPGFGFFGGGITTLQEDGEGARFGFSSRRVSDGNRKGSLALGAEEVRGGLEYRLLDPALTEDDVTLRAQSAYMELKRYFPAPWNLSYYWGLRGGYTHVTGTVERPDGSEGGVLAISRAPLALLALPFVLEDPGFLLLALADGASAGLVLDIVADHLWLDLSIGALILPAFDNRDLLLHQQIQLRQGLSLYLVF